VPDWKLLVVTDGEVPSAWNLKDVMVLDSEMQRDLGYQTAKLMPSSHYGCKGRPLQREFVLGCRL
jgi:hypothetical protein